MSDDISHADTEGSLHWILPRGATESTHLDSVFEVLSCRRNRDIIYSLTQINEEVIERSQLVDAIRTIEEKYPGTTGPSTEDRIKTRLHHVHLPLLSEAGIIDYDPRQGTVRYVEISTLEGWLNALQQEEQ